MREENIESAKHIVQHKYLANQIWCLDRNLASSQGPTVTKEQATLDVTTKVESSRVPNLKHSKISERHGNVNETGKLDKTVDATLVLNTVLSEAIMVLYSNVSLHQDKLIVPKLALRAVILHQHELCITQLSMQNIYIRLIRGRASLFYSCPFFAPKLDGCSPPRPIHCNIYSSQISTDQSYLVQVFDSRPWHTQRNSTEKCTFRVNCRIFDCRFA